ncbi:hypothetical protein GGP57_000987 [Salinibacter ruber]|uniref:ATP-binding protein n=1 Tax=Salinibacter ruber TaxID=146919 RepID=UPI0021681B85|nr:ATP-binding protein [Salinibacter ruber]MCS3633696.1 hypothetical protein [Salinibacter ruber]MCS3712528.1 hypothetical protein [Salinibacter ruber]
MESAGGDPRKDFFVETITKDVSLEDSILDLIDNCVDGARSHLIRQGKESLIEEDIEDRYEGYKIEIEIKDDRFIISDNCGGIPIDLAKEYAFYFGRRSEDEPRKGESIGLYGIGMKRSFFKIGKRIKVESSTSENAFDLNISVDEWKGREGWDFPLELINTWDQPGTHIELPYKENIDNRIKLNSFKKGLYKIIARDYSFIIREGLEIYLNEKKVNRYNFELKKSDEFAPARKTVEHEDVQIELIAGMAELPPGDPAAEAVEAEARKEKEYYGWFIICNDRVVLAADKSATTVWGHDDFPSFHTQYYGFMGLAFFQGEPSDLPWTTSKRSVDESEGVYSFARKYMKNITRPWIEYTSDRKKNYEEAEQKESATTSVSVENVEKNKEIKTPKFEDSTKSMANINYKKPKEKVKEVSRILSGSDNMSYRDVGKKTFEYYVEMEL